MDEGGRQTSISHIFVGRLIEFVERGIHQLLINTMYLLTPNERERSDIRFALWTSLNQRKTDTHTCWGHTEAFHGEVSVHSLKSKTFFMGFFYMYCFS